MKSFQIDDLINVPSKSNLFVKVEIMINVITKGSLTFETVPSNKQALAKILSNQLVSQKKFLKTLRIIVSLVK